MKEKYRGHKHLCNSSFGYCQMSLPQPWDRMKDVINKKGLHHKCTNPWSLLSSTACDQTMNLTGAKEVNQEQLLLVAFHITSSDWPLRSGAPPALRPCVSLSSINYLDLKHSWASQMQLAFLFCIQTHMQELQDEQPALLPCLMFNSETFRETNTHKKVKVGYLYKSQQAF